MSYIGKEPADSFISFAKQDFSTSATTSYTLNNAVTNENELALFINFVRQEPTTAYTASGTTLTLTSATTSSDDMYCVYLGQAKQTVNAPDGSVGTSQLAATSVTAAKLNNDIISGTTALASEPSDTDEFLVSDSGTLKRIDYSLIKSTPGRVLIKEIDASGVAAVTFVHGTSDVIFDTTYDQYQLTFSNVKVVGDEQLRLQALSNGSALTSGYIVGEDGVVTYTPTSEAPTTCFLETYGDVESDYILFGVANFYNAGVSSSRPSCYGQFHHERSNGTKISFSFAGTYNTEISDFNGITFTNLGGPNIASGKFKLYGIS